MDSYLSIEQELFYFRLSKFDKICIDILSRQETSSKKISIKGIDQLRLFGYQDKNLRSLEEKFKTKIVARGSEIQISGDPEKVDKLEKALLELVLMVNREQNISEKDLETVFELVDNNGLIPQKKPKDEGIQEDAVILYTKDRVIKPKSQGQNVFFQQAQLNDIIFAIGPAGTGKTFLAVAMAIAALRDKLVNRIVLTRPAVEAGESLGFLPGDFREKIDPYLRPLYDALNEMIPADKLKRYIDSRIIEIVPLAYMRGRTLNNSFVILDEAQNTTFNQMKMFLTRLGINSKAIITGDITQIDLLDSGSSGLVQIQSILSDIEGIEIIYLTEHDVVRHRLVREIIKAYEDYHNKTNKPSKKSH